MTFAQGATAARRGRRDGGSAVRPPWRRAARRDWPSRRPRARRTRRSAAWRYRPLPCAAGVARPSAGAGGRGHARGMRRGGAVPVSVDIDTPSGPARAHVQPAPSPIGALVLGHGAGGSVSAPSLMVATRAALEAELSVALVEQPYLVAARNPPPPRRASTPPGWPWSSTCAPPSSPASRWSWAGAPPERGSPPHRGAANAAGCVPGVPAAPPQREGRRSRGRASSTASMCPCWSCRVRTTASACPSGLEPPGRRDRRRPRAQEGPARRRGRGAGLAAGRRRRRPGTLATHDARLTSCWRADG